MTEDVSLDAFASSEEDATAEEDGTVDGEDAGATAKENPDPALEPTADTEEGAETDPEADEADGEQPAISTYAWSPEGGACADCGEEVAERWRAEGQRDGAFVCADCKEW